MSKKNQNTIDPFWEKVVTSRRNDRPRTSDLIPLIFKDFMELKGDRIISDDPSVIGGFGKLGRFKVMVIGQEKSRKKGENILTPAGVRKAIRLIKLADKYNLPIISLVDNPGTFPGFDSESKGLAYSISEILRVFYEAKVPTISVVIGEGGSGGGIAFAITDIILMLENTTFMVIAPEAASVIIYDNTDHTREVARNMKITSDSLLELKLIDGIIREPAGGAHKDYETTGKNIKSELIKRLRCLKKMNKKERLLKREHKYEKIGLV